MVNAEISARLQLYLGTLSSAIIALALVAQLSELGVAFRAFALVLRPVVFFLGGGDPWAPAAGRGRVAALRAGDEPHSPLYLEVAPEMERYFVLPATDDP